MRYLTKTFNVLQVLVLQVYLRFVLVIYKLWIGSLFPAVIKRVRLAVFTEGFASFILSRGVNVFLLK